MDPQKKPSKFNSLPPDDRDLVQDLSDELDGMVEEDISKHPEDWEDGSQDPDLEELRVLVPTRSGPGKAHDHYEDDEPDEEMYGDDNHDEEDQY